MTPIINLPARMSLSRRAFLGTSAALLALGALPKPARAQALQPGGVLRLGLAGNGAFGKAEPHSLDGDTLQEVTVASNIYEALTTIDPDGKLQYVLAEAITADDASATVWTIKLKPGVTFHNGKPLTADDVIFSLQRIAQPGTVTGGNLGPVSAYEKIDDLTLRLTLGAPRSWLAEGLADPFSGIVPADFDPAQPVGTGPWKLDSISLQQGMVLARHDAYHGTPATCDKVEITLFGDPSAAANALSAGQIDLFTGIESYLAYELADNPAFTIYNAPTGRFYPIQMRTDVPPFNDVRLRQALRLVIDRQAVVDSAWGGFAQKGNDLYAINDVDFASDLVRERDVEKARALITEAGLDGLTIELAMNQDMGTALILAENAKEIGITINPVQLDGATFYGEEYFTRNFFGGDYYPNNPFFVISALCDGPNPSLDQVRWRDEEYHKLWLEASGTLDADLRRTNLHRMQEILFDKGGFLIPAFSNELAAASANLGGLPDHDVTGGGIFRAMRGIGFKAA